MKNLIYLLILLPCFIFAQNKPYYYAVKTKLSDYSITAISQDKYGRLIIGTDKGLFSYNGFQTIQIPTQTLYSKEITSLIYVGKNIIGLTKTGQVFKYENKQVEVLPVSHVTGTIQQIKSGPNGELMIVDQEAVYEYAVNPLIFLRKKTIPFASKSNASIVDLISIKDQDYVLLSNNDLVCVNELTAVEIPGNKAKWIVESGGVVKTIPQDPSSNAVYKFQGKRFIIQPKIKGGINHDIYKFEDLGTQFAMLSKTGLMLLEKENLKVNATIVGFHVTSIFKDKHNTIWFGTKGRGLFSIPTGAFQIINTTEFQSLNLSSNGKVMVAENMSGIKMWVNYGGRLIQPLGDLKADFSAFKLTFNYPIVVQDEIIKQIIPLPENYYLLVSSKGLFRFHATKAKDFKRQLFEIEKREQLVDLPIKEWSFSESNELVFSSVDGVHSINLKNGELHKITYFNESIDASQILHHKGKWYVLTPDSRLYIVKENRVVRDINFRNDRNNIPVRKIKKVGEFFYLLSDNALYRTKNFTGQFERLGELSKLSDLALRDFVVVDNNAYIATQFGIIRIFWKDEVTVFPEFLVGKPHGDFQKKKTTDFSFQNTHVSIPFELIDLTLSHPFILQYRLIQDENQHLEDWHLALASSNELNFEHLRSGKYRLEIRLLDPGTKSFSKTLFTHFSIESAWYENAILWLLTGTIIGGFGTIYLLREKRRFKKTQIRKQISKRKKN